MFVISPTPMRDYYFIIVDVIVFMNYSELKESIEQSLGITVKEKPLQASDGRISGCNIAIREDIGSESEKKCVLLEELGHYILTVGDITRIQSIDAAKQEYKARKWAYITELPIERLHAAQEAGCSNIYEAAACLGVSERFLSEALEYYERAYGSPAIIGEYSVTFRPFKIRRR